MPTFDRAPIPTKKPCRRERSNRTSDVPTVTFDSAPIRQNVSDHGVAAIDVDLKTDDAGNSRASPLLSAVCVRGYTPELALTIVPLNRSSTNCEYNKAS